MQRLQEHIRTEARRRGFALCGFARLQPAPHADFMRQWLEEGNAASMAYIERGLAKRCDPRLILPSLRSIITVGYRYLPPPLPPIDWRGELRGRIAAYAFGPDYHVTMRDRLEGLADCMRAARSDAHVLTYVDTGAILEREWAAAGGIGWFGKNTNILHTQQGSYFFLGELLTNLEFEPDPVIADHCGTCTRCLDLCPTGALAPGYRLDARRCIAYWTIEHRGIIPLDMRASLGNWIFGCDVCQEVCPWNEKLLRREGTSHADTLTPYLPDLLQVDDTQFRSRFGASAIRRARREGLLRNVAVALGNTGNPQAVVPLAQALGADPSPLVRIHVAWALGVIGGRRARSALATASRREPDSTVQSAIQAALHGAA